MNNLYPVFVASHTRLLNAIFSKDEDDDYTEDFFGNTIFYYSESLDKIVTPTDIEKYHLQINKPDDILKNNSDIKCHFKRLPYAEALTDMAIQENAADGYDITKVHKAKIEYKDIFLGTELILFPKYLQEIAYFLSGSYYIYLLNEDYLLVLPESAILEEKGIVNMYNLMINPYKHDHTYDGVFYFDINTNDLRLVHQHKDSKEVDYQAMYSSLN